MANGGEPGESWDQQKQQKRGCQVKWETVTKQRELQKNKEKRAKGGRKKHRASWCPILTVW